MPRLSLSCRNRGAVALGIYGVPCVREVLDSQDVSFAVTNDSLNRA